MQPTHHLHISTGFMFVAVGLVLGVLGLILWYRSNKAQIAADVARHDLERERLREYLRQPRSGPGLDGYAPAAPNMGAGPAPSPAWGNAAPRYAAAPQPAPQPGMGGVYTAPVAPVYVHSGNPAGDMLMGMAIGSMMSGHHDTVVHETVVHDSSPAYDSGPSWDSGVSYDSGSSSPSSSDSSGGFDASW